MKSQQLLMKTWYKEWIIALLVFVNLGKKILVELQQHRFASETSGIK